MTEAALYDDGNGYYEDSSGGYDDGSSGESYDPGDSEWGQYCAG